MTPEQVDQLTAKFQALGEQADRTAASLNKLTEQVDQLNAALGEMEEARTAYVATARRRAAMPWLRPSTDMRLWAAASWADLLGRAFGRRV